VNYLQSPVVEGQPITAGRLDAIVDALWENVRWGKTLLHSVKGTSRAPTLAAVSK
jgi:hypothetical protein